jgi:hypothetical protein
MKMPFFSASIFMKIHDAVYAKLAQKLFQAPKKTDAAVRQVLGFFHGILQRQSSHNVPT